MHGLLVRVPRMSHPCWTSWTSGSLLIRHLHRKITAPLSLLRERRERKLDGAPPHLRRVFVSDLSNFLYLGQVLQVATVGCVLTESFILMVGGPQETLAELDPFLATFIGMCIAMQSVMVNKCLRTLPLRLYVNDEEGVYMASMPHHLVPLLTTPVSPSCVSGTCSDWFFFFTLNLYLLWKVLQQSLP